MTFEDLVARERSRLDPQGDKGTVTVTTPGPADEPWVAFTNRDHFGIALSGGGIRSATFNLGLLQALNSRRILPHVDYVSTVSGGGYVGGMWSAWRRYQQQWMESQKQREESGAGPDKGQAGVADKTRLPDNSIRSDPAEPCASFPHQTDKPAGGRGKPHDTREPYEIRHLREFSRFLIPRLGFFQSEMWAALTTVFSGMLAALVATTALLTLGWLVWFAFAHGLLLGAWTTEPFFSSASPWLGRAETFVRAWIPELVVALISGALFVVAERAWRKLGKNGAERRGTRTYTLSALMALALTVATFHLLRTNVFAENVAEWRANALGAPGPYDGGFRLALFLPALAWLATAAFMLLVRGFGFRFIDRNEAWRLAAIDRVISRCLGPAVVWVAIAMMWEAAHWLLVQSASNKAIQAAAGGSPLALGFLFAWLRDWLTKPKQETAASTLTRRLLQVLKPMVPQLLAGLAMLSFFVAAALLVQSLALAQPIGWGVGAAVVLLLALFFFDPARMGMHDFYRARISRCFLGAARADGWAIDRATTEQPEDDVPLSKFAPPKPGEPPSKPIKPIHLVCTTANNLGGDTLTTLYRGARSVVLSAEGITLGNHTQPNKDLRLSSALTASAAAFNSQMGRLSMDLGPAVAFMMTALNLRLGLWVPHPARATTEKLDRFPGLPYFLEMFGWTRCDPQPRTELGPSGFGIETDPALSNVGVPPYLHLSDGGHFENLGLYELVRRHCRYIIVSDCGADPDVAFDDLANALRCIREDFGVEIELDVEPLRPGAEGRSRQHAVVGTIHYNGVGGLDKGRLLYFKPTLTGDESPDVLQYRKRNAAFPHESTGDQFYDEAQWESYRRLGEHAGNVVLRCADDFKVSETRFVDRLFLEVGRLWHPAPERQKEVFLALTERLVDLEAELRESALPALRREFFPETAYNRATADTSEPTAEEEVQTLYFLMCVLQLMEDVWFGAELDVYWSHPMNDGWMNYFQRWASTPSLRRWWPVLRSNYSIGFRDFVRERFDLHLEKGAASLPPTVYLRPASPGAVTLPGMAWENWNSRYGNPILLAGAGVEFLLQLEPRPDGSKPSEIQVGFLIYRPDPVKKTVSWDSNQLFVPAALAGAGITARFLDAVIDHFAADGSIQKLNTTIAAKTSAKRWRSHREQQEAARPTEYRPTRAERLELLHTLNFYKSRGFVHHSPDDSDAEPQFLELDLTVVREKRRRVAPQRQETFNQAPAGG